MKKKTNNTLSYLLVILYTFSSFLFSQENPNAEWQTYFEKSGFIGTPSYSETVAYFKKFEKSSPFAKMIEFGASPQGRKLYYLVVSSAKEFTPEKLKKSTKPLLFVNNGIHAGEIEGKDASMMLLREILVTGEKKYMLDHINLVIIPIFSVDGHERISKYNRINQNGPEEMGWRTTAQNLNLNRDWVKADAPEMQAMLRLFSALVPDFFIDNHTTNGADYQYTVTYGLEKFKNLDDSLASTVTSSFIPFLEEYVTGKGFLIAPYVGFKGDTPESGLVDWAGTPRFSTGYTAIQNRIGLLVETHMMKPYKDRVYSTKAVMEAAMEYLILNGDRLKKLNSNADNLSMQNFSVNKVPFPVVFKTIDKFSDFNYKGIVVQEEESIISGAKKNVYTGEPYSVTIPFYNTAEPVDSVIAPFAYIIPKEWRFIAEKLMLHGIEVQQLVKNKQLIVTKYKFREVKFSASPYEGHQTAACLYDQFEETVEVPSGSYIIYTNQRTVRVIMTALEPKSGDSFLRWGFMNNIFERKEYFEDYVMEKVALEMYYQNKALATEFNAKIRDDAKFREDKNARLNWFYERSPYFDKEYMVYPVMRAESKFE